MCTAVNSRREFKNLRNGLAHANYGWEQENGKSVLVAYDEDNLPTVSMSVMKAEAFYVIVSAIITALLETIYAQL